MCVTISSGSSIVLIHYELVIIMVTSIQSFVNNPLTTGSNGITRIYSIPEPKLPLNRPLFNITIFERGSSLKQYSILNCNSSVVFII